MSALRLAGNAAAELGQHECARIPAARRTQDRTASPSSARVYSSPENCARSATSRAAERLLAQVLLTQNEQHARMRSPSARGCGSAAIAQRRSPRGSARGRFDLRAPQARLQSHRQQFRARSGTAGRGRRGRRGARRGHRDRHRDPHPRELGQSGAARAFPVRELRALRGPHRNRSRQGAARIRRRSGRRSASPKRCARDRWRIAWRMRPAPAAPSDATSNTLRETH